MGFVTLESGIFKKKHIGHDDFNRLLIEAKLEFGITKKISAKTIALLREGKLLTYITLLEG